jgi:hypothetical protein
MPASRGTRKAPPKKKTTHARKTEKELREEIHRLECAVQATSRDFYASPRAAKPRLSRRQQKIVENKRLSHLGSLFFTLLCLIAVVAFILYQARVQL